MALCDNCSPKRWCSADKSRTECRFYQPMTNEEWFASLTTEEKVKALLNLHEKVRQRMRTEIGGENSFYKGNYYRDWLIQPYTKE